ncbi:MAG: signal peptidase I [Verrucomicrobiales bacterium]|nr:signal peptidase I [Verrucomicrobiales bacterium]
MTATVTDVAPDPHEIPARLRLRRFLKQHRVLAIGITTLCGVALLQTQFGLNLVVGESMWPTFETGDLLLIRKRAFPGGDPQRGDIVVARYRGELIVKRVVGLPGEEVHVKNGDLFVDDALLVENHFIKRGGLEVGKGKLVEGKFAILGDNRDLPSSQTVHAVVSKDQIVGKVIFAIRLWRQKSSSKGET